MASYVNPAIQKKFETLSTELKNEILNRNVIINNIYDLMEILKVIAEEED